MGEPHASASPRPNSEAQGQNGQRHTPPVVAPPAKRSLKRRRGSGDGPATSTSNNVTGLQMNLPEDARREVEARRGVLLKNRTGTLNGIMDEHDSLVREAFHLEKFVTLVGYDPKVAKQDTSNVYQDFKSQYDLMNAVSTSHAPHSRKKTRGRLNQSAELLATLSSLSGSYGSPEPNTSTTLAKGKPRGDGITRANGSLSSGPCQVTSAMVHESSATNLDRQSGNGVNHQSHVRRRVGRPRKDSHVGISMSSSVNEGGLEAAPETVQPTRPVALPSIFANVKRIKVIHRPPPPEYTDPDQRPSAKQFGGSISAYLESYMALDDDDIGLDELRSRARHDAGILRRVTDLRSHGRLRDGVLLPPPNATVPTTSRNPAHWDLVINHVSVASRRIQEEGRNRLNSSKRASKAVLAHFEKAANAEDRERQAEEKRLRALAKFTVKEVIKKWKEAIQHVRDLRLAEEKAEQAKLGKEQLNAILEQSTQVLEAQHHDLSRNVITSRSRSSSTPASWPDSHAESDQSDGYTTEEEEEEEDEQEDEQDNEHEDEEEGHDKQGKEDEEKVQEDEEERDRALPIEGSAGRTIERVDLRSSQEQGGRAFSPERLLNGSLEISEPPGEHVEPSLAFAHSQSSATEEIQNGQISGIHSYEAPAIYPEHDATPPMFEDDPIWKRHEHTVSPVSNHLSLLLPEPQDPDFVDDTPPGLEFEDRQFEQDMELEDDAADGDSDEEIGGLQNDADIPIEDLLQQYGYRSVAKDDSAEETGDESDTGSADGTMHDNPDVSDRHTPSSPIHVQSPSLDAEMLSPPSPDVDGGHTLDTPEDGRIRQPFLLRGTLRPYQHAGLEWLVSLYNNGLNGILADEMGLGKTIQTIALLAHLACERAIWGPHLIIVPTSVILNWEMEFKRFLPGFKILTYYGNVKERREKRAGWNTENTFNVCITSYQLVLADQHIFRRKKWCYLILDEAHNIKNFRSQRWQTLLGFHSSRRLLLTGTPLQNNLMELWSLLYFLMPSGLSEQFSGGTFAGQKEFQEWFSNPMDKAIQNKDGPSLDQDTLETVNKLHTLLRPYLLRRMKAEVEKQLPGKYEHLVECRLSKRQRLLYDEFMQRASTRETLAIGSFLSVVNLLMQLRKICNHPDLFEVRPILTSFAMSRSAVADFEIKELLLRRSLLAEDPLNNANLRMLGLVFTHLENLSMQICRDTSSLDASPRFPFISELPGEPPPLDTVSIEGFKKRTLWQDRTATIAKWQHFAYINTLRCSVRPIYGLELLRCVRKMHYQVVPLEEAELDRRHSLRKLDRVHAAVLSYRQRIELLSGYIDRYAVITPAAVCLDIPRLALPGVDQETNPELADPSFDTLHQVSVKLQVAFPEPSLLQYDCGKLQELDILLRELKRGDHRVLIFTQMTRVLDILEIFLNFHGYRYLRLDGATKIEQRQIVTERFNVDKRIFAFIASSRSGGVGINLTGADAVIFFDSDFNPAMDRQCEDRAHRIGQTRDVHIYRFVTKHTIEENMLLTANQKRTLDDVVIRQGDFDWRKILVDDLQMEQALAQVEDQDDVQAARIARAEGNLDATDFEEELVPEREGGAESPEPRVEDEESEVGGTTVDYMVMCVERDWEYFGHL